MIEAELTVINGADLHIVCTMPEYHWLKDLLQNPIYEDETRQERAMRKKWFDALKSAYDYYIPF